MKAGLLLITISSVSWKKLQRRDFLSQYVDGQIFYGIKTGLNKAFVIDDETRSRLISVDPSAEEIIKPFLIGKDIKRYGPLDTRRYVLYLPGISPSIKNNR
jgi:hypothetical protein